MKNDCYVIFKDAEFPLAKMFLKSGFGHVYLMVNDGYNWLYLDATRTGLEAKILSVLPTLHAPKEIKNSNPTFKVLKVHKKCFKDFFKFRCLRTLSCVSFVSYYLNLPWYILTPYQLYKYLCKHKKQVNMQPIF